MRMATKRIIIGISGASGSLYAHLMLKKLAEIREQLDEVAVVVSKTGEEVWKYELPDIPLDTFGFRRYPPDSFFAPMASGSSNYDAMIIIPCSVGTLGRIAAGTADDLMTRAADVMLKEHRKLILAVRETPLSLIHIRNMASITKAGGIILPASPGFYMNPKTIEELCMTVVKRVLSLTGLLIENKVFGA
jgi:4-hydroxy-3-polyprenylbenzoate decarboxylase